MLARKADRLRRQLAKIIGVAPARDDAAREFFCQHNVRVERKMRPVLLDRPDWQTQDRARPQALRNVQVGQIADRPARHVLWHGWIPAFLAALRAAVADE